MPTPSDADREIVIRWCGERWHDAPTEENVKELAELVAAGRQHGAAGEREAIMVILRDDLHSEECRCSGCYSVQVNLAIIRARSKPEGG